MADGCSIGDGVVIENSIVGLRCQIGDGAVIRNSILMGADYYEPADDIAAGRRLGRPPIGVGASSHIDGAIVDKNVRIGAGVHVVNERGIESTPNASGAIIQDGIVVLERGTTIPDGWRLDV